MKKTIILFSCAASLMMIPTGAQAQEETPLGKQMEAMNDAYKVFRRETDPVKGAALAREAQDAILKAALELPEQVRVMTDGPEKAKAAAGYRKMMGILFSTLCDVEIAFLDGNIDEVANIVERLKDLKKEGHDKFMEE